VPRSSKLGRGRLVGWLVGFGEVYLDDSSRTHSQLRPQNQMVVGTRMLRPWPLVAAGLDGIGRNPGAGSPCSGGVVPFPWSLKSLRLDRDDRSATAKAH